MTSVSERLFRDMPAIYQICVQGTLTAPWVVSHENLTVKRVEKADLGPVTVLIGELADQAALMGLLNNIYDLGYPLLSCSVLDAHGAQSG